MPGIGDAIVGGIFPVVSAALEKVHQLAIGTGCVTSLTVHNYNATARTILLLDQTATPIAFSTTAVTPIWAMPVAGLSTTPGFVDKDWTVAPLQFKNGLWIVLSTVLNNPFSCTTTGTADLFVSATINQA